jgi:hypothetical protein
VVLNNPTVQNFFQELLTLGSWGSISLLPFVFAMVNNNQSLSSGDYQYDASHAIYW